MTRRSIVLTRTTAAFALLSLLTGCSFLESLVPDKQKQYRYSTELPPLEVPPDLSEVGSRDTRRSSAASSAGETRDAAAARSDESDYRPAKRKSSKRKSAVPQTTLAQTDENSPLIEVEAEFPETWNDVSRALGRLHVQITDQNRSEGVFYVTYGGEQKPFEEKGLWHDLTNSFFGDGEKGTDLRIKLAAAGETTHVFVLDESGKAPTDGPALELLKRLHQKLQTLDQPEKDLKPGEKPEEPESP